MSRSSWTVVVGVLCAALAQGAAAQNVKVTPLGGFDGEFCAQDRALVFEDPNGTRVLYDPGRSVAGATDARLGRIDIILVSHMHGDHVGDVHTKAVNAGTCDKPDTSVSAMPESSAVEIALAKKSKIVTGSEMPPFFAARLKANGGDPANSVLARFGGSVTVGGVRIATVAALHSNGLVAWLSGDTGILADQKLVIHDYYDAKLAVMNMGDGFTTGPAEAAYVINDLVKPASVIPSHANEAGTVDGKVRPGSRTEAFIKAVKIPVHVPLSGRTMEFDAGGRCVAGC